MNRRSALTLAAAAITLLTLAGAATGCQDNGQGKGEGGTTQGHILKSCATEIVKQPRRVGHGTTIEAQTHSECDKPPVKHTVFITVQYHPYNSDTYITMGTKYCEAIPVRGIPTDCHVTLPQACRVGIWRMRVQITGSMPNGTSFSYVVPNKATRKIKSCSY